MMPGQVEETRGGQRVAYTATLAKFQYGDICFSPTPPAAAPGAVTQEQYRPAQGLPAVSQPRARSPGRPHTLRVLGVSWAVTLCHACEGNGLLHALLTPALPCAGIRPGL